MHAKTLKPNTDIASGTWTVNERPTKGRTSKAGLLGQKQGAINKRMQAEAAKAAASGAGYAAARAGQPSHEQTLNNAQPN